MAEVHSTYAPLTDRIVRAHEFAVAIKEDQESVYRLVAAIRDLLAPSDEENLPQPAFLLADALEDHLGNMGRHQQLIECLTLNEGASHVQA